MKKKIDKLAPGLSIIERDLAKITAFQDELDRQNRLLGGLGVMGALESKILQVDLPGREIRRLLEQQAEAEKRLRELVQFDDSFMRELRQYEEMLKPQLELINETMQGTAEMQMGLNDLIQPFDPEVLQALTGQLIPDFRMDDFLGILDLDRLQKYVAQATETIDLEPEDEDAAEDAVLFDRSVQIECISVISEALIEYFARYPEKMREMPPRGFEELVAKLLSGSGFEVELTQQTRDGGRDIIAVRNEMFRTRHLIECKRYREDRAVSVSEVRALYGVIQDERGSQGIIVTTSRLSPDARTFIDRHTWELEKREFDELKKWILDYLARRSGRKLIGS